MKKLKQPIISALLVCCILHTADLFSQTLSPNVSPTSGGYFAAGGKSLSWTLGETFNTTLLNGTKMLTQGEQQPYIYLKLLNLKAFIEGFYAGGGQMRPVLFNDGLSGNPANCDTITVELHNATSPYDTFTSANTLLRTDGTADVHFPVSVLSNSYYIAIRHRNALETWSKIPVKFNDVVASFDFTTP